MYDEPLDVKMMIDRLSAKVSRCRTALFKRRMEDAFAYTDTVSFETMNMIWKQVMAEVV
jgi:hypothetical protein